MRTFPDSESIAYLAKRRVRYIVVRQDYFTPDVYASLKEALNARPELHQAARFAERQRESVVFELR